MLRKILFKSIQVVVILNLFACGTKVQEEHKKQYILSYAGGNAEVSEKIQELIAEFNQQAGFNYLSFTKDPSQANSLITLTKGLELRDGKIGWGQWITSSKESESYTHRGSEVDRTINYSMDIELDWDYVTSRIESNTQVAHYELQKLFFHEIGHGLQMSHSDDPSNLMYATINGEKNFEEFFTRVRIFFAN